MLRRPMKKPLYYSFGNHMHWTDMQWLWGYDVLASSVRDMLALCAATGARGNVNFDAVGYEKMAVEAPEALAELRAAIHDGSVEIVGASYGQPYGLFHGGESNVRQLVFGVRTVQRLFGVRPRAFWEEEFYFFPQLPQLLRASGYTGASLFFQWTWHTPTIPSERAALIQWEGLDGTRIPCVPKNELSLHQWPEDFEGRLDSPLVGELALPAILQWVELLPSPDWMCRSEVLIPRLKQLFADPRFELRPVTLSGLIQALSGTDAPIRRYGLDDVFHGVSLSKNGDRMPRASRGVEEQILAAESIAALAGLFGRPYASWDVYPTWELEEAWRELLSAQHHDVHECEGLCGFVGERSFERALGLASHVFQRTLAHLARRVHAPEGALVVFNPLGWTRDVPTDQGIVRDVPPFGYKVIDPYEIEAPRIGGVEMEIGEDALVLARGDLRVEIDRATGLVKTLVSREFPEGALDPARPSGRFEMTRHKVVERFEAVEFDAEGAESGAFAEFGFRRQGLGESRLKIVYSLSPVLDALVVRLEVEKLERPDGGMRTGLQTEFAPSFSGFALVHDHPYGVSPIRADGKHLRKYPSGDWMTSPQWFEEIVNPFTALSFVDMVDTAGAAAAEGGEDGARGLLLIHDGGQAFFRDERGVRSLLTMYDPWDEESFLETFESQMWIMPHGPLTHAGRMRLSLECNPGLPRFLATSEAKGGGDLPSESGALHVDAPNVIATAFYRESRFAAKGFAEHFAADVRDPFVVRMVEFDGRPADVLLRLPGKVAKAARTNLLGEIEQLLTPKPALAPFGASDAEWSSVSLRMRPHEIATVMLDLELGRAVPRNLDEHRHVWATVHRRAQG